MIDQQAQASTWANKTATYEIGLVMGKSGVGKTSLVESIVVPAARAGHRVWAVDPNGAWEGVEGVRSVRSPDGDYEGLCRELEKTPPGTVIFDDADGYLRFAPRFALVWMTSHRHLRKNIILISRRPQGLTDILGNADWYALFMMREEHARRKWAMTLGEESAAMIPSEPYKYLYHRDPFPPVVKTTPPRAMLHRSEIGG